ncbi:Beta-lactamase superfamily domain protein [Candidatus Gugararchaeum adminiculabundum]|nr:Beta-lactamase superfamily domain protein [Candidatus Gugararchaeum adminiculabundum]
MDYLRYLGHSSMELSLADYHIYFDPFFGNAIRNNKRMIPCAIFPDEIRKADLIFISNEREDHCDAEHVRTISERCYATVVAPPPALAKLKLNEKFRVDAHPGDKFQAKGVDVEVVSSSSPQSASPVGYVVRHGRRSIYFAGATYEFYGMGDIRCDIAILPIGGSETMDTISACKAVKAIKPKLVIPIHYNTYPKINADVEELNDLGSAQLAVLGVGDEIEI